MSKIEDRLEGYIQENAKTQPEKVHRVIASALKAFQVYQRIVPVKEKTESRRYLADVCTQFMLDGFRYGDQHVLTSIYMPCEIMHAYGLTPMCAEMFATYMNGVHAENTFVKLAEEAGVSETFCSYHKIVMGAFLAGVLPKADFIINSSLACDANNLTFRSISHHTGAPQYYLDVPYQKNEDSVQYVAEQLKELFEALSQMTGKAEPMEQLKQSVRLSQKTIDNMLQVKELRKSRYLPGDLTSELYEVLMMHNALGTKEAYHYSELLLRDYQNAPLDTGTKIVWMHTNPFWQKPVMEMLNYNPACHVIATELSYDHWHRYEETDPFRYMAKRIVYNNYNGSMSQRIEETRKLVKELDADGVVVFCHWGCKQTCGGSALAKTELEKAGIPTLILNGDGVDRKNASDGQTSTRLGAFIEMLEDKK